MFEREREKSLHKYLPFVTMIILIYIVALQSPWYVTSIYLENINERERDTHTHTHLGHIDS